MKTKRTPFTGVCTALITPFRDGKVDYPALARLLERQIEGKADAVLVCGTTGEAAALSEREYRKTVSFAIEQCDRRLPVIAGAGSNRTAVAVSRTRFCKQAGADAVLQVTPYYNKTSASGLIRHFETVADCAEIPVILYNVPSRTGMNIPLPVYERLSEHPGIVAVKEASGSVSDVLRVMEACGDRLSVYSGSDELTIPLMAMGAAGVISVLSNLAPERMHRLTSLCAEGKLREAAELQLRLLPLTDALFLQVNPIPVKTAAGMMGLCSPELRLPLREPEEAERERLRALLRREGLLPEEIPEKATG